ncbi:MAG: NAD(P)(+) transhydrogenase (Re/Si-specific) subunit beta [Bacteroidota bacterium]
MENPLLNTLYLISIALFIIGLKRQSHPDSARNGNLMAASGMGLAMIVTLFFPLATDLPNNYGWIFGGIFVGGTIGLVAAKKVQMTAMPEMVSLFNGFGGAATMTVAFIEFFYYTNGTVDPTLATLLTTVFAVVIGSVSFTGSVIAWGKLNGSLRDTLVLPAPQIVNAVMMLAIAGVAIYMSMQPSVDLMFVLILLGLALVYGVTFVLPIGGGDMPVVISLLNSFTGIGAAFAGLIYGNQVMIVGGILVGAAGIFLTILMCDAMNRSLLNVVIGGFGGGGASAGEDGDQVAKEATVTDTAIMLKYAQKVMVVPGYGLAVAQAQHAVHELEKELEKEGVQFKYAVHPVAGRMPGHMNVLLAEADVPYTNLLELDDANRELPTTDVVMVVGANDVVNPAAKTDQSSPIYGMPIIDTELAKNTIIMKRSMNPGYAGIQNPLFFKEKSRMLFGDAKQTMQKLIAEVGNV